MGAHKHTVVLDPGHGGRDRGGGSDALIVEKDHCLRLAKQIRARYDRSPVMVYLTREDDTNPNHGTRCLLSRRVKADMVLSLHINSQAPPYTLHGFRAFYWPRNMRSKEVGIIINERMPEPLKYSHPVMAVKRDWRRHTGWRHYPGKICAGHTGDALVLELGFVTDYDDYSAMLLRMDEITTAIAAGIDYHRSHYGARSHR